MRIHRLKLFWIAFWVIGFAVAMTGLLLYFKYQSVFTGLQSDRVVLVISEIDSIAEKNLSLGQDFWGIPTLQDVIERRREADALIQGIVVAGADGKIAYATDLSRLGSSLPDDQLAQLRQPGRAARNAVLTPTAAQAFNGSTISNSFGQPAGYAVLAYSREPERLAMRTFTTRLIITCSAMIALFTAILYAALAWMWQRTDRELVWAADALAGESTDTAHAPALAKEVQAIRARLQTLDAALDRVAPRPASDAT